VVDVGERAERARHADLLPRRAEIEADPPREPGGAGEGPLAVPAGAGVEPADQAEQPMGRRVQVRRELRDLVGETVDVCGGKNEVAWPCARVARQAEDRFRGAVDGFHEGFLSSSFEASGDRAGVAKRPRRTIGPPRGGERVPGWPRRRSASDRGSGRRLCRTSNPGAVKGTDDNTCDPAPPPTCRGEAPGLVFLAI